MYLHPHVEMGDRFPILTFGDSNFPDFTELFPKYSLIYKSGNSENKML
jgi:hypothetical protein